MKKRQLFAWEVDSDLTAVVTTAKGVDSRVLAPFGDLSSVGEMLVLEPVIDPERPAPPLLEFAATGLGHPRIISARAAAVLAEFLHPNGELTELRIRGDDRAFYAFTPRRVLDVLDERRSRIKPTSYGRYLVRAAFRAYDFADQEVFIVRGFEDRSIFVTDAFVRAVGDAHLRGARFDPQIMSTDEV